MLINNKFNKISRYLYLQCLLARNASCHPKSNCNWCVNENFVNMECTNIIVVGLGQTHVHFFCLGSFRNDESCA